MAPNNRRRRNRQRRSRPRGIIETFTFSVLQGNSTSVLVSTLTSRPPRSNFRPVWFEVEVCGYQPGSASLPGFLAPVGCQIGFRQESDDNYASTSRLILTGATAVKVRTRYPRSADWWPYNTDPKNVVADINAVCVGPTTSSSTPGYLRGIGRMLIILQEEDCATSCPSIGDVIHECLAPSSSDSGTNDNSDFELVVINGDAVKINTDSFDL